VTRSKRRYSRFSRRNFFLVERVDYKVPKVGGVELLSQP